MKKMIMRVKVFEGGDHEHQNIKKVKYMKNKNFYMPTRTLKDPEHELHFICIQKCVKLK